ncbi:MAG TPA: hypothetical protein VFR34_09970 [Paracoccaceae bacterium]|nr:hypothetical protein [Paracoccaceae bacterium]
MLTARRPRSMASRPKARRARSPSGARRLRSSARSRAGSEAGAFEHDAQEAADRCLVLELGQGHEDVEFGAFIAENARSGGELVLGRVTYELLAAFWPTPLARERDPVAAVGINAARKPVFSRTGAACS